MAATPLRHARIDAGLSQFELAHRSRVSQGRLSMIERGLISVGDRDATAIAAALGVNIATIFPQLACCIA